jgi:hypothetical protein
MKIEYVNIKPSQKLWVVEKGVGTIWKPVPAFAEVRLRDAKLDLAWIREHHPKDCFRLTRYVAYGSIHK